MATKQHKCKACDIKLYLQIQSQKVKKLQSEYRTPENGKHPQWGLEYQIHLKTERFEGK